MDLGNRIHIKKIELHGQGWMRFQKKLIKTLNKKKH